MFSERVVSYHANEQVVVDVGDNFRELINPRLPDFVDFLNYSTYQMVTILAQALVEYHNAPIIIFRTAPSEDRKQIMMAFSEELSEYLDQSKLRYNHIYGVRMAINVILLEVSDSADQRAQELETLLRDLDNLFFLNGNHPDAYPSWHIDDQISLAVTINPEIERTVTAIESLCC